MTNVSRTNLHRPTVNPALYEQCVFSTFYLPIQTISQLELQNDFDMSDGSANKPEPPTSYVNFHCGDIESSEQTPDQELPSPSAGTLESQPMPFHTLILDLAGVCFIDLMGIKVLTKVSHIEI